MFCLISASNILIQSKKWLVLELFAELACYVCEQLCVPREFRTLEKVCLNNWFVWVSSSPGDQGQMAFVVHGFHKELTYKPCPQEECQENQSQGSTV